LKSSGDRVLFVDDFKDIRDIYAHFLSERGFEVIVACDGKEALDRVTEFLPDIVVMDLSLPGLNGWEVIQRMKQDVATQSIPVILLTAHGSLPDIDDCCAKVLSKPCHPDKLVDEINRVIHLGRELRP
jgi:CheY-like chemotaxis protein